MSFIKDTIVYKERVKLQFHCEMINAFITRLVRRFEHNCDEPASRKRTGVDPGPVTLVQVRLHQSSARVESVSVKMLPSRVTMKALTRHDEQTLMLFVVKDASQKKANRI
jgi:hypothetical protein